MVKPLVIPFTGEYWLYYWPLDRPPKSALIEIGDPTEFKFTAAGTRLNMEARQSLGTLIDPACCGSIEVDVTSTDPMPGTTTVELVLRHSAKPDLKASLGEQEVMASGKLRFEMPAQPALDFFDEMVLVFRLRMGRAHRSANVSVDGFALNPH